MARGKAVARHEDHHGQSQLGHGVGVLPRGVHHHDAAGRSGREVHVVIARTGAHDNLEHLGGIDDFGRHLVAAHDQRIGVGHGFEQLGLVRILLEQGELMARTLDDFANSIDRLLGKGFLGRYQYFHGFEDFCVQHLRVAPGLHLAGQGVVAGRDMRYQCHIPSVTGSFGMLGGKLLHALHQNADALDGQGVVARCAETAHQTMALDAHDAALLGELP